MVAPLAGMAEGTEERAELPDLAADALSDEAGGAELVRGLELSAASRRNGSQSLCATTEAFDANGYFIGLTYWQIDFNAAETEVQTLRNVTGLNSACYGESYERYGN
jgi:hypothetical protein